MSDAFGRHLEMWHPEGVYLNTASYGLPPDPVWEDLQGALREWRTGSTGWIGWSDCTERARESFAGLVNTTPDLVAVGSTVAQFAGLIAASLPAGSKVLAPEVEFTSNLFPWMVHEQRGVKVHTVEGADLVDAIDDTTELVAVSAVQSATGEVADLEAIATAAHSVGAAVFVDATQACGWLPIDASGVDYLACGAYKWLMAPRGTAFMTVNAERIDAIVPLHGNWFAGEDVHDSYYGPPLRLAESARRFDTSPAWFSWVGTAAALRVLEDISGEAINKHDVALANRFRAGAGMAPSNSAIVALDVEGGEDRLRAAAIHAATRAGDVRLAFHLYNTESDVDAALDALFG